MHIEIDTERMTLADGVALMGLIHMKFPNAVSQLALMSRLNESAPVLDSEDEPTAAEIAAAEAFAGGPGAVVPSAEEAFAPLANGASGDTSLSTADTSATAANGSGPAGINASPPTLTASLSSVPVDADGYPWDARIHSSGKEADGVTPKKNGDGRWAKKRGVSADTVTTVQAELKAALAAGGAAPLAPTTADTAPPPPTPPAPTASPATIAAPAPAATALPPPAAPAAPAPPAPPAPAPDTSTIAPVASAATTALTPEAIAAAQAGALANPSFDEQSPAAKFTGVMSKVTQAQAAGKLQPDDLATVAAGLGLDSLRGLIVRPDLVPQAHQLLDGLIASYG